MPIASTPVARLLSVATASPPFELPQEMVVETAERLFARRYPAFRRLKPVFSNAGVRMRRSVRPFSWFEETRGWPERAEAYLEGAGRLFEDAAKAALKAARLGPADVDIVVTVSSTGIATPSLEARAAGALGLRDDVARWPVFGLGCAGGVAGLALASRLAEAEPGKVVLLVVVELCTLSFRLDELTTANIVATALFGDGAAACVVRAARSDSRALARFAGAQKLTWPDTLDVMGWRVDPEGFGVIFAQSIPGLVRERMAPAVAAMLARLDRRREDVDRFICHPGGRKVLEALEEALAIPAGALDAERAVLADHGNMSAPTVLFVLKTVLEAGLPPRAALLALGPGFSADCVFLEREP